MSKEFFQSLVPIRRPRLADGYHALAALQEIFPEDSDKRKIVDYLIAEPAENEQEERVF